MAWKRTRRVYAGVVACFPAAFSLESPKPLKTGIFYDILDSFPDLHPRELSFMMRWYTGRKAYLLAVSRRGQPRYDLAGQPCGAVGHKESYHARQRYRERMGWRSDYWPDPGSVAA
jgi:ProP effector